MSQKSVEMAVASASATAVAMADSRRDAHRDSRRDGRRDSRCDGECDDRRSGGAASSRSSSLKSISSDAAVEDSRLNPNADIFVPAGVWEPIPTSSVLHLARNADVSHAPLIMLRFSYNSIPGNICHRFNCPVCGYDLHGKC